MNTAYLSLGSNLGHREANLHAACERLESPGVRVLRRSSIYETEPQDVHEQPWFLNMVVEIETSLAPAELLARAQEIERDLGRQRTAPKGPRIIDIDILLYAGAVIDTAELQIPHPRLAARRFVLEPLAEIAPRLRHPATGLTALEMLAGVKDQIVRPWNPK